MPRKQEAAAEDAGSKSARTRERILDAAAHVLSRKGYAGTRLSDVADQAEIQAPAIYYYFPSRDDLIEEVMWSGIAHMREHMTRVLAALPPHADPLDRIDAAVEAHLRYCLEISDYTTASIRNAGQVPENIAIRYAAEASQYGDMWRKLLQDADNAGLLRPDLDPMAARMMVLGALNWAAEWWNPRRGSLDTVVRTAQSLVRHGLGYRPEGGDRGGRGARAGRAQAPAAQAACVRLSGQTGSTRRTVADRVRRGAMARPISPRAAPETSMRAVPGSCRPLRRGRRVPGAGWQGASPRGRKGVRPREQDQPSATRSRVSHQQKGRASRASFGLNVVEIGTVSSPTVTAAPISPGMSAGSQYVVRIGLGSNCRVPASRGFRAGFSR